MTAQPTPRAGLSRTLVVALAAVLVLGVVGALVVVPLLGADEPVDAPLAAPVAAPAPEASVEPEAPAAELAPVEDTFEVFTTRDPFDQLVDDSPDAGGVAEGAPAGNAQPVEVVDPEDVDPAAATDTTTEAGTTVVVEDVFADEDADYVLLTANGTAYTLMAGEAFATGWRVDAIDDPCVTVLYGDQARLVCEGESIRK